MTTSTAEPRSFTLGVPPGFIRIQPDTPADELLAQIARVFNTEQITDDMRKFAAVLTALTPNALTDAIPYVGLGLFRSPQARRPILLSLSCLSQAADHDGVRTAVGGLLEVHRDRLAREVALTCGPAVITLAEEPIELTDGGQPELRLLRREITAWVPDPAGTAIAVVSVSSNNWQDWEHISEFALGLFNSLEWTW